MEEFGRHVYPNFRLYGMQDARRIREAYFVYRVYTGRNDDLEEDFTTRTYRRLDKGHVHLAKRAPSKDQVVILLGKKEN